MEIKHNNWQCNAKDDERARLPERIGKILIYELTCLKLKLKTEFTDVTLTSCDTTVPTSY